MAAAKLSQLAQIQRAQTRRAVTMAGKPRLQAVLMRAEEQLQRRVRRLRGSDASPLTMQQAQATLKQVRAVLADVAVPGVRDAVMMRAKLAAERASMDMIRYLSAAEKQVTNQPLALEEAVLTDAAVSGSEASVLRRLGSREEPGILQRYSALSVAGIETRLQQALLTRQSFGEFRDGLVEAAPFLEGQPAHWAERIARTEMMGAYNRGSSESIVAANEQLGDVVRILAATFDDRTGWDSYMVHGQIRRPDEPFEWPYGSYMYPPNRPNDREVVVPHRLSWPLPRYLKPVSDGMVAAVWTREGRKGAPPPRPNMSTVPLP